MLRAFKKQPDSMKLLWLGLLFAVGLYLIGFDVNRAMVAGMSIPFFNSAFSVIAGHSHKPTLVAGLVSGVAILVFLVQLR